MQIKETTLITMDILKSNCPKWEDDLFYAYPNGFLFIGFSNKKPHVFLIMVVWWCIKNCSYWVCYIWNACHIVWFFFNKIHLLSNVKCVLNFWSFCCWWFLLQRFFGYICVSLFSCFCLFVATFLVVLCYFHLYMWSCFVQDI